MILSNMTVHLQNFKDEKVYTKDYNFGLTFEASFID